MALGFFNRLAGDRPIGYSAGSEAADQINQSAVAVMAEVGIDTTAQQPQRWTHNVVEEADVDVALVPGDVADAAHRAALVRDRERTQRLAERAQRALSTLLQRQQARADHAGQLLAALSYKSVLARGFALVRDETGHALHNATAIAPGMRLDLEFADGRVAALADGDPTMSPPRREPPKAAMKPAAKRPTKLSDQGDLF